MVRIWIDINQITFHELIYPLQIHAMAWSHILGVRGGSTVRSLRLKYVKRGLNLWFCSWNSDALTIEPSLYWPKNVWDKRMLQFQSYINYRQYTTYVEYFKVKLILESGAEKTKFQTSFINDGTNGWLTVLSIKFRINC